MLTGQEINLRVKKGDIIIEPYKEENLNPNSYNLALDNKLFIYNDFILDMKRDNKITGFNISKNGIILHPNQLYLGRTKEYTETYNLVPCISGRSSIGRLGINIHVTAGFGDIGFKGFWTLEIFVIKPVKIYPDMKIGQIYYYEVKGDSYAKYDGKYQNNKGVQNSKLYKELNKNE